ncbi:protein-lysine N-methyltransferase EFM3 isoform X1 [Andrographis paniculata]|uniref:protein-lysine N-methyltransferase EFM3 isoform X1 n=1 Tax=Andrographis paniculata TaxID=175694 RepID=UPI0021E8E53F|nr:protein-lysine N-methyltransferase EFM3 isoform X1 [Andrographis paniculata]
MVREGEDDDDIVCLDESFFVNDDYQLTRFAYGSQVLELYCLQSASTDFDLTGQLVWPGAELMNDYLSKHYEMLRGCSVIELGIKTSELQNMNCIDSLCFSSKKNELIDHYAGITGILCSRFCSKVVLTDHNDEVLKILKRNIELHQSSQESHCLATEKLEWGNSEQLNNILQKHPEGFDLVLGADICFQQSSIPLLFNTVGKLLRRSQCKTCKFILAYVSRAKVMDNLVVSEASQQGLHINEVAGTRTVVKNLGGVIYEVTSR